MTPRACETPAAAPRVRLAAALCASALLHTAFPLVVTGGASRQPTAPLLPQSLSVRVVPAQAEAPLPAENPVEKSEASEAQSRIARVTPSRLAPPPSSESRAAQPRGASDAHVEAPDLTYYPAKQLDVYPALASALDLKYRGKHGDDAVIGRALLLVLIDEVGVVKDVSVVESQPANDFEDDAKRAFLAARFSPAYRNGRAVRSRVLVEVNYGVER